MAQPFQASEKLQRSKSTSQENDSTETLFKFASIQNPRDAEDPEFRRQIRSHAVKQGLQAKRRQASAGSPQFRTVSFNNTAKSQASHGEKATQTEKHMLLPVSITKPLQPLPQHTADALTLRRLLGSAKAKQALEPVFSIGDNLSLQSFRSVFRTSLHDPALLSAVLLTTHFGVGGDIFDDDCLRYQLETIKTVRERISLPDATTVISTLGAILLLAGVEIRMGIRPRVELHMKAVYSLLQSCSASLIFLTDGIKRAIFWQDLYGHVLTESDRTVDHQTFAEMQWQRDVFAPGIFILPPGFESRSSLFDPELIEVLKDVNALSRIRDSPIYRFEDTISMMHVDNQQASIQSRLSNLGNLSFLQECCRLAAYLSANMMCCKIWRMSIVPPHLSGSILQLLQQERDSSVWDGHDELLTWLLYVGGSFAPEGPIRLGYIILAQQDYYSRFTSLNYSWSSTVEVMKQFIWSDKAFEAQVATFWEETRNL